MKNTYNKIWKHSIIKGTMLLTCGSFICRILGFIYRLLITKKVGILKIGLLELVMNIMIIPLCLCTQGSRIVLTSSGQKESRCAFDYGITYAGIKSIFVSVIIYAIAPLISTHILHDTRTILPLRILALSLPFTVFATMCQGLFILKNKYELIVKMQILEELVKIGSFLLFYKCNLTRCEHLASAILLGEIIEAIYGYSKIDSIRLRISRKEFARQFIKAYPITINKLYASLFTSIKNIILPTLLISYGMSKTRSIQLLGEIRGVAMPIVLFPVSFFTAYSSLLLPKIADKKEDFRTVTKILSKSLYLCLILGFASTLSFHLGISHIFGQMFDKKLTSYLNILCFLSPLLDISLTANSILNGLGHSKICLKNSLISSVCEIILMFILIKRKGIYGYLICILSGELIYAYLNLLSINKIITTHKECFDIHNN